MAATRKAMAGFTLLEAIVAMVVFSLGAFALYGWLSTNLITLQRLEQRRAVEVATLSALDVIRGVNPTQVPRGSREVGALEVSWDATLVEPARDSVTQVGNPNLFRVGLYDLEVRVLEDGREINRFHVRQVGREQVRFMELE